MPPIIAVHCGAGNHSVTSYIKYKKLCKKACRGGYKILENGGSSLEAVKEAIRILENDPLTNCGYGSNLTNDGHVEGDASIMDGSSLIYGGCGAVRNVKNPIGLAYDLCVKQKQDLPMGLVPPAFLTGRGATLYARKSKLKLARERALISPKAWRQFQKYKGLVEVSTERLDTVGAVCVDNNGCISAGSSSGGILLKNPGRVGQAGLYASGVWADSYSKTEPSVAVSTSGCGEYLLRTQLAKEISEDLKASTCPTMGLHESFTKKFLDSRYLTGIQQKLGGALVLHINSSGESAILWGHSTESMSVGYMKSGDRKPKALISVLPPNCTVGTKVTIGGVYQY